MRTRRTAYIRTDTRSDLLNSLDHCLQTLILSRRNPQQWKWTVISAYSAAQVAMVIVLEPHGDMKHLQRDFRVKMREYDLKEGTPEEVPYPESELNSFEWLVKCCIPKLQSEPPANLSRDLDWLRSLRDKWTHFGLYDYIVPVSEARRAVLAATSLIASLPLPSSEYLFDDDTDRALYDSSLEAIVRLASAKGFDETTVRTSQEDTEEAMLAKFGD